MEAPGRRCPRARPEIPAPMMTVLVSFMEWCYFISGMNPEHGLMLQLLRPAGPNRTAETRRLLERGPRWDALIQSAGRNAVVPQICGRLLDEFPELIPPAAAARLRTGRMEQAKRSLVLSGETARLLSALEGSGIPAMPYK